MNLSSCLKREEKMTNATITWIWAWREERKKDQGCSWVWALIQRGKEKYQTYNKHNNFCFPLVSLSVVFRTSITHKVGMNMDNGTNTEHQQVKQHWTLQGKNNHMNKLKKLNSKCTSWIPNVVLKLQKETTKGNKKDRSGKLISASKCWD